MRMSDWSSDVCSYDLIGTGGKVIREIVAKTGAKVDIDDEGVIKISSSDLAQIEAAKAWILGIVEEAEVGKVYNGKVVNLVDFGAFVNFMGGKDGLVHVSEIRNERVEKVSDVLSEGQEVKVKVLEIDNQIGRATSELQSLMRISYAVFCLK